LENLRPRPSADGGDQSTAVTALNDDDVLYVHADLSVTNGMYVDENVIRRGADPEWQSFCSDVLGFSVPDYMREKIDSPRAN
jgi:hypothetical protein